MSGSVINFGEPTTDDTGTTVVQLNESLPGAYNYSKAVAEFLKSDDPSRRDPLYIVIPITIIYIAIFSTGVVGNISTCVVIARNRSMHTATNYYLFSLAISDLLLLISGLPPEMYYIWSQFPYIFGEVFCVIQSFAAETSANATVLTITAFTVERYVAICHPFISHTMSKLSRAVKFVVVIWLCALGLAIPQAIQFGVVYSQHDNGTIIEDSARCTVKWVLIEHAFGISTMLFFVVPMTIITVLYVLIGVKLRRSRLLTAVKRTSISSSINHGDNSSRGRTAAQRNVIRMLVAVVVAFFICWAPFHAQRLLAVYAQGATEEPHPVLIIVYTTLTYVSGIFYYLSTTINPLLYNIMSNKFREAFKTMLSQNCGRRKSQWKNIPRRPTYSALSRRPRNGGSYCLRENNNRQSASVSISEEAQRAALESQLVRNDVQGERSIFEGENQDCVGFDIPGSPGINGTTIPDEILKNEFCRGIKRSISRGSSNSSQYTVTTSVSKKVNEGNNNTAFKVGGNYVNRRSSKKPTSQGDDNPRCQKTIVLSLLADRIRFGTRGLFTSDVKNSRPKVRPEVASAPPRLKSETSIESANTISNSSLQDLDETEFTGSELARYMGEVNFDLIT
ncbi:pyrokinin-1 receptor-like [Athalia rosae]|uniref:pyrokinin-1 receptor-like n=1 Tax=Athalia rosae TaxID=37344 RepID=UPI00203388D9|nr:pyrokinin-1 receptor-like [Athalia rosae]